MPDITADEFIERCEVRQQFLYHLKDTLVLLGGNVEIARLLLDPDMIDETALDVLRQYNIDLQTLLKDRLVNQNSLRVSVA